jgi:hypothetical protein
MKKYDYIIGIDPDSDKSGFALLEVGTPKVTAQTFTFPVLLEQIISFSKDCEASGSEFCVVVEASWHTKANFHFVAKDNRRVISSKGYDVGRNHEVGRKIVECLQHLGIEVKEVKPLKKFWKGNNAKITHDELAYFVPGLPKRTCQEVRDSVLLCWSYAGFPIRIPIIKNN